jgi:hypothetical protein
MISRRVLVFGTLPAALVLSSCQYCYDEPELIGTYRAQGTRIRQTLILRSDGAYVHSWLAQNERVETTGAWRAVCMVELDNFALPGVVERMPSAYLHGGPPEFWSRRPTISLAHPDITFVPVRE